MRYIRFINTILKLYPHRCIITETTNGGVKAMYSKNLDLKTEAKAAGVYLWQIADKLGMRDNEFSRKLRKELSAEKKAEIRAIIKELSEVK